MTLTERPTCENLQEENRLYGFLRDHIGFLQARIHEMNARNEEPVGISVPCRFSAAPPQDGHDDGHGGHQPIPCMFLGLPVYRREQDTVDEHWEIRIFSEHTGYYYFTRGIHE